MAEHDRWGDRDREWREDRSWNERGRTRGRGSEERWRQMHADRRREGPAGYNDSGPVQGGWEFGDEEQGGYRGQGYERYGYGRGRNAGFEAQRYAEPGRGYYNEFGRDPNAGTGYGETWNRNRDYGRGGDYGGYSTGQSRHAYGAHTPYGYRGRNEYDERGRGGEYADDGGREHEGRTWLERAGEKVSAFFGGDDEGRHRGRGPKGYRRSDERIREDVSDRLTDDPWLDASGIEVEVAECEVVLKGKVATREDKRRAENLADAISGVRNVQNHLRVDETRTTTGAEATSATSARNGSPKGARLQAPDSAPGLNT